MATDDTCCTLVPYFKVHDGKLANFKALCERFVAKTGEEEKCLFYGFSFDGDQAHCREGYRDAAGILAHLENVGPLLDEALTMAEITRLEVHGRPVANREALANPEALDFYVDIPELRR